MAKRNLPNHPLTFTAKADKSRAPADVDPKRWKKQMQNCQRAERLTGVAPVAAEGWETVAVILMNLLEGKS
jgi:hypothetical protein